MSDAARRGGPGGPGGPMRSVIERVRPKNLRETLGRLGALFGTEAGTLAFVFIVVGAETALLLAGPWLVGRSVDAIRLMAGTRGDGAALVFWVIVLACAYGAGALLQALQHWTMAGVSQRAVRTLRDDLFAKLTRMPVRFFDTRPHGDIMSRVVNDADAVSSTLAQSAIQLFSSVTTVAGALVFMFALNAPLALVCLAAGPLVYLLAKTVVRSTRPLFREQQAALGRLNGDIEETFSGLEVVRLFGREGEMRKRFAGINERLSEVGAKAQIRSGFLMPMMNVINNLTFAAIAFVGGALMLSGRLASVGVIASFLGYSRQFVRPLNEIANVFNTLMSAVAGAERVFETLDETEEPEDREGAVALGAMRGDVEFRSVGFSYQADRPVLSDISFEVEAGSLVALVGPTGAGKTTVVNLLARFYDVDSGAILIDGTDIRDLRRDSLRSAFGIVLQDTSLSRGTIAENIAYGKPGASFEEVRRAATVANAHHFIERLENGYGTELSENGGSLSQGERQLIAIARVALSDPSILILDEATSSVDTRTELHIRKALVGLMAGRTSFVIAHRLSTIRDADLIFVIDGGRILERGTHEELVASGGFYKRMYEAQKTGDYE